MGRADGLAPFVSGVPLDHGHHPPDGLQVGSWQPTRAAVERLASDAFGVAASIKGWERLAPWSVGRARLSGGAGDALPGSVVVKWLRDHPSGTRARPSQVATERAALEFLAGLGVTFAPRLLAGDHARGVLVLEDLHPRVPLSDVLAGDRRRASAGLRAFARALGELHAATVGREDAYYERRGALGPVSPAFERERFLGRGWRETPASVGATLGVPPSPEVERDLAAVLAEFSDPGPFLAFSNGDAGPNNFMFDGADGRLIDFEFAGYRHALSDAACLFVPGPAWVAVDPLGGELEAEYRRALCQAVPEAADDRRFGRGMAAAALAYAVMRLGRFAVLDARPPGDGGRAQRVSALEHAAAVAAGHRSLPHLSGWARGVAEALRRRWPDADFELAGRFQAALGAIGVELGAAAGDVGRVIARVADPGPFLALVHGDAGPGNERLRGGRLVLLDFGTAGQRHALLDGVCGRMAFPTGWCARRLPARIPVAMEDAYRSELARGCPAAADDEAFAVAAATACGYWLVETATVALPGLRSGDVTWGTSTVGERLALRTRTFARVAGDAGEYEALAELLARVVAALGLTGAPMPLYPAFGGPALPDAAA